MPRHGAFSIRNGYEYTFDGAHWVASHREAYFSSDRGKVAEQRCHWCSKPLVRNGPARKRICIDHLEDVRENNDERNLVPSCRDCNMFRGKFDAWVREMGPARFEQLLAVTRDNWEQAPPNAQRQANLALFVSVILKAVAEAVGVDVITLIRKWGVDAFPEEMGATRTPILLDEQDIFKTFDEQRLAEVSSLLQDLAQEIRAKVTK